MNRPTHAKTEQQIAKRTNTKKTKRTIQKKVHAKNYKNELKRTTIKKGTRRYYAASSPARMIRRAETLYMLSNLTTQQTRRYVSWNAWSLPEVRCCCRVQLTAQPIHPPSRGCRYHAGLRSLQPISCGGCGPHVGQKSHDANR